MENSKNEAAKESENSKQATIKDVTRLYNKGLFNSFINKDQVFEPYLTFSDKFLLENTEQNSKQQMAYTTNKTKNIQREKIA